MVEGCQGAPEDFTPNRSSLVIDWQQQQQWKQLRTRFFSLPQSVFSQQIQKKNHLI